MIRAVALLALAGLVTGGGSARLQRVPFVGCAADGQMGPLAPPRAGRRPMLPPPQARQLAFYAGSHVGVLAPRGWHCVEAYGSNGAYLIVTPTRRSASEITRREGPGISGPAVMISYQYGGTSGRWAVAAAIARYFPDYRAFHRRIEQMGLELGEMPAGPDPDDIIRRRTATEVEFITPPGRLGDGTRFRLAPGPLAVDGFVMLLPNSEEEIDVVELEARLPAGLRHLNRVIVRDVRRHRANPGVRGD